jgi:hypothetical protein
MMKQSDNIFVPLGDGSDENAMIAAAYRCVETFTDHFNAQDLAGMDAMLHFPHIILSAEQLVVWQAPGQLPASFFQDLIQSTGWHHSTYQNKRAVLVSTRKVHLVVEYSRDSSDGTTVSFHQNLWIVTYENDRWGIKQRSY